MHIPTGWTTAPAGGYGNFTRLTHDECGWYTEFGLAMNEHRARQIIHSHECEDKREAREAAERRDDQLGTLTRTVTALETALLTSVSTLPGIAVLDLRDPATLTTSLAALHHTDRATIARGLAQFLDADRERTIIDLVRDTASDEDTEDGLGFRDVVGVRFQPRQEEDGYYLSSDEGTVLFAEGDTATAEFPGIARLFADHCGCVGPTYSLIVDLRGTGTVTTHDNDNQTIHHHLGVTDTNALTLILLAEIRTTIKDYEPTLTPIGVAFRTNPTEYEDGFFLEHNGQVLFSDATTFEVPFGDTGRRLAQLYGNVGTHAVAWVDLTEGTITRDDDGFDTIHHHFNLPTPD